MINSVFEPYDAFLIDLWGVVHDGVNAYPGVIDALNSMKNFGKELIFVSNVPRPADIPFKKLQELGLNVTHDMILTSGDVLREYLVKNHFNTKFYHLGENRNADLLSNINISLVDNILEADTVLLSAFIEQTEAIHQHDELFKMISNKGIPTFCANPDKEVMHGEKTRFCAGTLAERLEILGGKVIYYGKPHTLIFETAFERLKKKGITLKEKVLMIGDTLETDIQGAINFGIDSALVLTGNSEIYLKKHSFDNTRFKNEKEALLYRAKALNIVPTHIISTITV